MMNELFGIPIQTALGNYVFDANTGEILCVSEGVYNYLRSLDGRDRNDEKVNKDIEYLQRNGYCLPSMVTKIDHPLSKTIQTRVDRALRMIILQVTRDCNLRCKYCVYSEEKNLKQRCHSNEVMSLETAKKAVDFYRIHSVDSDVATIGFYGGEPLLEFNLITEIVEYAEAIFEGKKIVFSITTNATLLTEPISDYLFAHHFVVTLSVDGPERIHNKNRVFRNGTGSYSCVVSQMEKFVKSSAFSADNTFLSIVTDPDLSYEELDGFLNSELFNGIQANVSPIEEDGLAVAQSSQFVMGLSYDEFLSLFSMLRNSEVYYANSMVKKVVEDIADERFDKARKSVGAVSAPSGPCVPGKTRLFVNCQGMLFPCEKVNENEVMRIGNLDTGFDYEKIDKLLNISKLTPEKCRNCWAFSLCNVCARMADNGIELSGKTKLNYCEQSKQSALFRILYRIVRYESDTHVKEMRQKGLEMP